jgi:hypothetical protein
LPIFYNSILFKSLPKFEDDVNGATIKLASNITLEPTIYSSDTALIEFSCSGTLTVNAESYTLTVDHPSNGSSIHSSSEGGGLTIAGGTIQANGQIFSKLGDLTISGGTVTVESISSSLLSGGGIISISGNQTQVNVKTTVDNLVPIVTDFSSGNVIEITDGAQVTAESKNTYVLSAKSGAIKIADSGTKVTLTNPDTDKEMIIAKSCFTESGATLLFGTNTPGFTVSGISPDTDLKTGGTTVTVTGTNLSGVANVAMSMRAGVYTEQASIGTFSAGSGTFTTPDVTSEPNLLGVVDVRISNSDGTVYLMGGVHLHQRARVGKRRTDHL